MYHYILLCDLFCKNAPKHAENRNKKWQKKKTAKIFKNLALYEVSKSSVVSVL